MSENNPDVVIIEKMVQGLIEEKSILSFKHEKIIKELSEHLEIMGEPDDRNILDKISVINSIDDAEEKTLEVWLKDIFHITEDELKTDDQKKRFVLEVERATITEKIVQVNNDFAKTNQQLKRIDPTREFIGMSSWDASSLEAYGKIASLERRLRDWIHEKWYNQNKSYWNDDRFYFPKIKKDIDEDFESHFSSKSNLRKIDFLDFSAYGQILGKDKPFEKDRFFKGNTSKQRKIVSHLEDVQILRNKIMHRPPLNDEEYNRLNVFYHEIRKIIDESYEK